jgi:peptidyl-prolyl cis-trans isomerase B (cyclophilin B)
MKKILMLLLLTGLTLSLLTACGEPREAYESTAGQEEPEPEPDCEEEIEDEESYEDTNNEDENSIEDENNEIERDTLRDINRNIEYIVEIIIEGYGTITVGLDGTYAPETVINFVSLVEDGFYDGLTFHRIIDGFMAQGGCPIGNGTGGSGTHITGEFMDNGIYNPGQHIRGAISMARAQDFDSASSQFFIVHQDALFLDTGYAVFGHVIEGLDVLDEIVANAQVEDSNGTVLPENQPVIRSISVINR